MSKLEFIYNGVSSTDLGIVIKSMPLDFLAEKRIEKLSFPKIDGFVYQDDEVFESYSLDLECIIHKKSNAENINKIKKLFRSRTGELILSRKPNNIFKVRLLSTISFEKFITNTSGRFLLSFEVQPFSYLTSGREWVPILDGAKLINQGNYKCMPLYKVTGASTCSISINNKTMNFSKVNEPFIVDVENEDIYSIDKTKNLNKFMLIESDFLLLDEDVNSFVLKGITKLEILPNWRVL